MQKYFNNFGQKENLSSEQTEIKSSCGNEDLSSINNDITMANLNDER